MKRVITLFLLCCSMATMAQNEKGVFSIRPMAGVNLSDFSGGVSQTRGRFCDHSELYRNYEQGKNDHRTVPWSQWECGSWSR